MRSMLRESITRNIILLVLAFVFAFGSYFLVDGFMHRRMDEIDGTIRSEMARRRIGRVIIRQLLLIRGDVFWLRTIHDPRDIDITIRDVHKTLGVINQALTILQDGGSFTDVQPANFDNLDQVEERYQLDGGHTEFSIPVIELRPDIQEIAEFSDILGGYVREFMAAETPEAKARKEEDIARCVKELNTYLHRARENAMRLFYDAQKAITTMQEEQATIQERYRVIRYGIALALGLTVLVFFIRIMRSIRRILWEREEYTRSLKVAHESIRVMFEALPAGLILIDEDRKVQDINSSALKLMGFSREDCVGKTCWQTFCPSPLGGCPVFDLERTLQNEERLLVTGDGRHIPIMKNTAFIDVQGRRQLLEVFIDITRQKKDEEQIRIFSHVVAQSPISIVITDTEGRIVDVNERFSDLTGYAREDVIGNNPRMLKSSETPVTVYQELWETLLNGKPWHGFFRNRKKNGELFWEEAFISPIIGPEGEVTHYVAMKMDVTRQRQQQQQLQAAKEAAESANKAKGEFLANMSHELRTPMNGVLGMTNLLLDTELDEEQRIFAQTAYASGNSLLNLINDILDFSKIEAGKLDVETLDFDLTSMLDDFAAAMMVQAAEKGLELVLDLAPEVPTALRGDPARLRQILTNLVGNAIKFTERGVVSIEVRAASPAEVEEPGAEAFRPYETLLRFVVRDTGIGVATEKIPMLFEKFTQADASHTRKYGGTGLGLAISRHLVHLLGGEIGAESPAGPVSPDGSGGGAAFWFTACLTVRAPMPIRDVALSPFLGMNALVVHPCLAVREVLAQRLVEWGIRVVRAEDGACARAARNSWNSKGAWFVFVHENCPEREGLALSREIRAESPGAKVMVLRMGVPTAGAARPDRTWGDALLFKPLRMTAVLEGMNAWVKKQAGEEEPGLCSGATPEEGALLAHSKARILVVEDNATNQLVVLGILKNLGLQADAVSNGEEALNAVRVLAYDLILMDIQMPIMDGLEAARAMRAMKASERTATAASRIPILALTAHAMQGDRERCLEAGMNDHITKPISSVKLIDALRKWLPQTAEGG